MDSTFVFAPSLRFGAPTAVLSTSSLLPLGRAVGEQGTRPQPGGHDGRIF